MTKDVVEKIEAVKLLLKDYNLSVGWALLDEVQIKLSENIPTKPPTVEIGLEDAQLMLADVTRSPILSNMGIYQRLKEAISKAEGKDKPEMEIWIGKNLFEKIKDVKWAFDPNAKPPFKEKDPVNGPALSIQDQVNELRCELSTLKDTISQLQRVIEGMKVKLNIIP